MATKIEWVRNKDGTPGVTWNPFVGCTHSGSPGCDHCYARETHNRRHNAYYSGKKMPEQYAMPFDTIQFIRERLELPLKWKKPRTIFVNSVSDLFHPGICDEWIHAVYDVMEAAKQHTFIICTKRPERIISALYRSGYLGQGDFLHNVWHLTTVENQGWANIRIPELLWLRQYSPGWRVLGVSVEPMLGPISLNRLIYDSQTVIDSLAGSQGWPLPHAEGPRLDWVICGGETGPDARPMHPDWVRSLRDQCQSAGVPFFFKSWGEWVCRPWSSDNGRKRELCLGMDGTSVYAQVGHMMGFRKPGEALMVRVGKKAAGRLLDGRTWEEMPGVRT